MKIIIAILIFSFIIIFHELGHFITARRCGVQVNEFCIGFGPQIVHFKPHETTYSIRLLPFGGACVMEGEDEKSDNPRAFSRKPVWQRFLIVLNGPMFNFILAYILSAVMIASIGVNLPKVSGVMDGYPAQEAGLQAGDTVKKLNNYRVNFYAEVSAYVFFHPGENITVTYERDGQTHQAVILPKYNEKDGRYLIGIEGNADYQKVGIPQLLGYSFCEIRYQIYTTVKSLGMLITGKVGVRDLSGPVGIVKTIGDTYTESAKDGAFYVFINMLNIAILLTANLGVMNLLPFPALDGGRLIFFIVEMIRRKPASQKVEGFVNLIGFGLLMALMAAVMASDVMKLFG